MDLDTIYLILAIVLLFVGIVLALFGRAIWAPLLSTLGGIIGWMLGFAVGIYFFGWNDLLGIILTIICAFVGSFIIGAVFGFLVELALAFIAGVLAGALVWWLTGSMIASIIVFAIVLILAYMFIEKVVIIVTAIIGSLLAGAAALYLWDENIGVLVAITLFIGGIIIQFFFLEDYDTFSDRV